MALAQVAPQLRIAERLAGGSREASRRLAAPLLGGGQDLRQVQGAHARARRATALRRCASDTSSRPRTDLGIGVEHRAQLVRQHRRRHIGVLDREGPAEAAALLALRAAPPGRCPHRAQQPQRLGRPPAARAASDRSGGRSRGAGSTPPRRRRRAGPRGTRTARTRGAAPRRSQLLAQHARAGRRRAHHRLGALENARRTGAPARRPPPVARVQMHLAAAGLLEREVHLVAEALQQPHHGPAHAAGTGCRPGR